MQNYHKHTYDSNIFTADSAASIEEYAKRAVELNHKIISSVEHGWQGSYHTVYEMAKKYNLKFVFGTEAYWVDYRFAKDRTNKHIIILAKNENGRQAINDILAEANITGYYFKPRVDVDLLLTLPKDDVVITTACVAFWNNTDDELIERLHDYFGENFYLEIQYHNTEKQIELNKHILELSNEFNIEMIVGLDSHYIKPEDSKLREYILAAKQIFYDDEDGWYMDYPNDETVIQRFLYQGVFTKEQIQRAMDNTDICLTFDDYDNVPIFTKNIKLPKAYPDKTQEETNEIYSRLITKKFKEYTKGFSEEEYKKYFEGVKREVDTYKNTSMVDYPLIDYKIVNRAIEKGGLITDSGRGSGVGYFTNTLCGFSKVDRFRSPIKLYPERFISETRILETHSLPDLDLNCGNPEIFAEAQEEVLTEIYGDSGHSFPMIAFGTFKKKSSFKLFARAMDMDFDLANEISEQIGKYDEALKYAEDDEKDEINIYDYVDEKYHDYLTQSKPYWGVKSDKKKAPCAFLIYSGNIRKEIGLIKCKSESTKKEYITTVIDGSVAENYKFLKNDLLKVDVVLLINKIFERIGIEHFDVNKLTELVEHDEKVWKLYENGFTIGLNQCEKESTTKKVMKYKPKNISELTAFIAAIRPSFKSMYSKFESREPFDYGIPIFDKIIQTEQFPYSFILYQEQTMNTLNYAGFPMDECYGIIKAIAKKHPEKVRPLKARFIEGFKNKIIEDGVESDELAQDMSEKVWQIISDSCGYGFNSAHAYCMAIDSLYCAWLKANYPYEFYEVLLQHYSDKGDKDKVALIKREMLIAYNIKEGEYKFGVDNTKFVSDKDKGIIYSSIVSIKNMSQNAANEIYELSKNKYDSFYDVCCAIKNCKNIDATKLNILVKINYFSDFGNVNKITKFLNCFDDLYKRSQFSKDKIDKEYFSIIKKNSTETEKQFRKFDYESALKYLWDVIECDDISLHERLSNELKYLGYIRTTINSLPKEYCYVQGYECKFKNPKLTLYRICNGDVEIVKIKRGIYDLNPINVDDIIKIVDMKNEGVWLTTGTDEEGKPIWEQSDTNKEKVLKKYIFVR